ncbi:TRAP transporter small permease [Actibacterium sp. MT2.3-13A]|uniref:TRAP transporter small permease n=1 Tax=Actibacterium sp. MT2.3-13A TaxID=2828332 RepID=UPI001BAA112D|nr:TRAP transporter small permease [Actibacterium sp. MT2.3-13A]
MLRSILDATYRTGEILAAFLFFLIFAMILTQIGLSLGDRLLAMADQPPLGLSVPAYAEFAAYLMSAGSFLGLAGALRAGVHVRVTLLLHSVAPGVRRLMEVAGGIAATVAAVYFCWRLYVMVHESWLYSDTSYGLIAIPIWIPQAPMVVGSAVLAIAFADYTVSAILNRMPDESGTFPE